MKTIAFFVSMMFAATVQAQDIASNLSSEDDSWENVTTDSEMDGKDDIIDISAIDPIDASHSIIVNYGYDKYYLQSLVWKHQTELRPYDANAWLNYFRHTRYMLRESFFSYNYQDAYLMDILEEMEKAIPDTYEYHTCAYFCTSEDQSAANQHAEKALQKLPANKTFFDYDTWFAYMHLRCDKDRYAPFAKEYYNSGLYSQELIQQNMNELNGMKANGIFIGDGDATIIPKWLIIDGMGKHQDKIVLCYSYLFDPEYLQQIYNSLGIGEVPAHEGEFSNYEERQEYIRNVIQTIVNRTGRELYFTKFIDEGFKANWDYDLYDEGMVYHYSPKEYNALKVKKYNYENVYDLSYLLNPMDENRWEIDKTMSWRKTIDFSDLLDYYKTHDQKRYEQLYAMLKNSIDRVK